MNGASASELLVDTDVFIDHLRRARKIELPPERIAYSVITRCELFSGRDVDEDRLAGWLAAFRQIPVDSRIAEGAGRIRRSTGLHTPDALIAATAIEHRLTLVTRNLRHFERVPKLKVRGQAGG